METQNEELVKLRNRVQRPREWSATIQDQDGTPIYVRDVVAWNWEHALSQMEKFCDASLADTMTVRVGTLSESEETRTAEEIGSTQTHYPGTALCSEATR